MIVEMARSHFGHLLAGSPDVLHDEIIAGSD